MNVINIINKYKKYPISISLGKIFQVIGNKLIFKNKYKNYNLNKNKIFDIKVNDINFKMSFNNYKIDGAIIERIEGRREPETTAIIRSTVKEGSKVLELGGCYGYFTCIISKSVGNNGKVVSIEGLPNNYDILKNNIVLNQLNNVSCYNFFVASNKKATMTFDKNATNPYKGISELKKNEQLNNGVSVPIKNLGIFLGEINFEPTHIFIDIEGFEIDAIEHLIKYLKLNNKPQILFEIHKNFYEEGRDHNYIIDSLQNLGYKTRLIADNCLAY